MQLRELFARVRDRMHRDRLSAELAEEMQHHRALLARDGNTGSFGNATYYREEARAMWSLGLVDDLLHDVRYATRVLRRDFGFTAAVVLTLALGIGANTAVFSIVNAVLLRPLPYGDPERLVSIWTAPDGAPNDRNPSSLPDIRDWQKEATVFTGLAGYGFNRFDITGDEGDAQARGVQGTGTLYEVLGATPLLGRMPRADEENAPVVAISHRLWLEQFGGDHAVLGKTLRMNRQPYTIVGVMPSGFHFPTPEIELWGTMFSILSSPNADGSNPWVTSRTLHGYRTVARLRPGVTIAQAEQAMNVIQRRLATTYPQADAGMRLRVQSVRDDTLGNVQRGLWTVFGAAVLILLLACVNVAHLLLARTSSRQRELAVRRALGAHRSRVLRQLMTESVVLGLAGGVAGVIVALVGTRQLLRFIPDDLPRVETVHVDATTLAFALGLSLLAALLFGVVPALLGWGGKRDAHDGLRTRGTGGAGGIHGARSRSMLTALEVAFAVVLLVGAGLMLRSFAELTSTQLGVQPSNVVVAQLTMTGARYADGEAKTRALEAVLANVRAIPGVSAAGGSTTMVPDRIQEIESFAVTGEPPAQPGKEPTAIFIPASPGFLDALHVRLDRGRLFDARDDAKASPVMIVNRELVRRHFARVDPIGRTILVNGRTRTIVGVVDDVVYEGLGSTVMPEMYLPFSQEPFAGVWIAIRTTQDPTALAAPLRDAFHRVDGDLAVHLPVSLESMVAESVVRPRFHAWLLSTFGALALVLASIGIYGVIAYGVTQRRSEIGIRLALGAPADAVVRMILRNGMVPVVLGLFAGLGVAFAASRVISGLLYGVAPTDTVTYLLVAAVLGGAGLVAAYVPARRAATVDPLTAIRTD
jgi:putative ABC transport system permease protein